MQQTTPKGSTSQCFFQEETNSFRMQVRLTGNEKLSVTLYDFVDWKVYEKQYTVDDIGKEIHPIADLDFIYSSLAQNKSDQKQTKLKETGSVVSMRNYKFGQCVKNGETLFYKIESEGRITVFMQMIQVRSNKKTCYQSKLQLKMVREMNQMEIFTQKAYLQKVQSNQKFVQELQTLREQKKQLSIKYQQLQKQNTQIKQQLQRTNQQLRHQKKQMSSIRQYFENQISTIRNQQNNTNQLLNKTQKVFYGQSNSWQVYQETSVNVKINYQHLNLKKIPKIFTSLYGESSHWLAQGATSIYHASNKQFMVYVNGLSQAQMLQYKVVLHYQIIPQQ